MSIVQLLRPEAGILSPDQLSPSQVKAGKRAIRLLQELCSPSDGVTQPESPARQQRPHLDRLRQNRVILLDGERGAGKTALLVTLIDALKRRCYDQNGSWPAELKDYLPWDSADSLVVPVDVIDLAPLPPTTNVLMSCVRRLDDLIRNMEQGQCSGSMSTSPPWHQGQPKELPSRAAWKKVVRAITLGWDSRLDVRVERQDIESYAHELEETERQRECLGDLIAQMMDLLGKDYLKSRVSQLPHGEKTKLLFLFAIDDADMNPERTKELLDAVRLLYDRRLAFLLTGESNLFAQGLRREFRKALSASNGRFPDKSSQPQADRLALDVLDKLIPPAHRCKLTPLSPRERMEWPFRLLGRPTTMQNMSERLDSFDLPGTGQRLGQLFRDTPQLAEVLPMHLRALINFALLVDGLADEQREAGVSALVEDLWLRALRSASMDAESSASRWIKRANQTSLHIEIPGEDAGFIATSRATTRSTVVEKSTERIGSVTFALERIDGEKSPLKELAGVVRLAVAIASTRHGDVVESQPSNRTGFEPMLAAGEVYSSGSSTELPFTFAWPLPQGLSMIEAAAFGSGWNNGKSAATLSLAEDFLRRVARYGLLLDSERLPESAGAAEGIDKMTPYQMVAQLAIPHGSVLSTRYHYFLKWAQDRAGLLAAPESGLCPEDANELLAKLREATGEHEQWVRLRRRLRIGRQQRTAATVGGTVQEQDVISFDALDRRFPAYNWKIEIEIGTPEHLSAELARRLAQHYSNTQLLSRILKANLSSIATEAARKMTSLFDSFLQPLFSKDIAQCLLDTRSINVYSQSDSVLIRNRLQEPNFDSCLGDGSTVPIVTPMDGLSFLAMPLVNGVLVPRKAQVSFDKESRLMSGLYSLLSSMKQLSRIGSAPWLKDDHAYFQGVVVRRTDGIDIPWPMPPWRTALSVQMFHFTWNELIHSLKSDPSLTGNQISWKLFVYYVSAIFQTGGASLNGDVFQHDNEMNERELKRWLVGLVSAQVRMSAAEDASVSKFSIESLPLLAAPESGLNLDICQLICDVFNVEVDIERWLPSMEKARLDRLIVATKSKETGANTLAEYEKVGKDGRHPFQLALEGWRKRYEQKTEVSAEAKKE